MMEKIFPITYKLIYSNTIELLKKNTNNKKLLRDVILIKSYIMYILIVIINYSLVSNCVLSFFFFFKIALSLKI